MSDSKSNSTSTRLEAGDRVKISRGDNKGETGTLIDKSDDPGDWRVHLDGGGTASVPESGVSALKE